MMDLAFYRLNKVCSLIYPRKTSQIVLSGKIKEFTTRVRWSLAKSVEKSQEATQ